MAMQTNLFGAAPAAASKDSAVTAAIGASGDVSDLFTKLLVAQIRNQNPLEPQDASQFVNQLTQLSQMESLRSLSTQTAASTSALQGMQVLALGAQVGATVMARTDRVTLADDRIDGAFTLNGAAAQTRLVLTGADGVEHAVEFGTRAPGEVDFSLDPAKLGLAPGVYALRAETDTHEAPAVEIAGTLASVRLSAAGAPVLGVSHLGEVTPSSITRFNGRAAEPN